MQIIQSGDRLIVRVSTAPESASEALTAVMEAAARIDDSDAGIIEVTLPTRARNSMVQRFVFRAICQQASASGKTLRISA